MRNFWFDGVEMTALGLAVLMAVLFLCSLSCTPETDLIAAGPPAADDPAGAGTAAGALVDPRAGTTAVPWNLAAVSVRLPAAIVVGDQPFRLRPSSGTMTPAPLQVPGAIPCATAAGSCYRVSLAAGLAPSQSYVFEVLPGVLQADGGAAAAGVVGVFDTGADADQTPPQISGVTVTPAGPCVEIGFATDEPVDAEIVLQSGGVEVDVPAGADGSTFELAVPLGGLPPGASAQVIVQAVDRAGNVAQTDAGMLDVPPATPPLAITEVHANALGPEPAQEFVELRNLGDDAVSLDGLRLEDSKGGDVLPALMVPAGAYVLVVPSGFDAQSPLDVPPLDGTLLVRVDSRLGSDGLSNSGEPVRLRMPGTGDEPIVSSYGGWVDVSATSAAGKSAHRLIESACDQAGAWTQPARAATPGWGTPP